MHTWPGGERLDLASMHNMDRALYKGLESSSDESSEMILMVVLYASLRFPTKKGINKTVWNMNVKATVVVVVTVVVLVVSVIIVVVVAVVVARMDGSLYKEFEFCSSESR